MTTKHDQPPPLLLFYASRQIGGGEAYFINLGLAAVRSGRRCIVVDYADGYVASRIPGAERIDYTDEHGAECPDDCVAFMPLGAAVFLGGKLRLHPEAKVLFVSIHHHHAIELGSCAWLLRALEPSTAGKAWPWIEPRRFRTVRDFFRGVLRRRGLVYCAPFQRGFDESYLGLPIDAGVVPIPVQERVQADPASAMVGEAVAWVSRLVPEKAVIILGIIRALKEAGCTRKLIVIGDGPSLPDIRAAARASGVELETPGIIAGHELDAYLRSNALLCVCAGTASIEMAMAGLPTLVTGLPGRCGGLFAWIHDVAVGDTLVTADTIPKTVSLSDVLERLGRKEERERCGRKCREAAAARHDVSACWDLLAEALEATRLTAKEAEALVRMDQQPFRFIRRWKQGLRELMRPWAA